MCPAHLPDPREQPRLAPHPEDWEPELLVCGLPYTLSGQEGPQAASLRKRAQDIASAAGIPLQFADERLSSVAAKRILREKGLTERDMRGKVDMIAASLFLQAWLDARRAVQDTAAERQTSAARNAQVAPTAAPKQ